MRTITAFVSLALVSAPAQANNWEKFYTAIPGNEELLRSSVDPETIPSTGNLDQDLELMWKRGYAPLGYSSFTSGNSKTKDAERLGRKIGARYYFIETNLESSRTASIPWQTPTSTTSHTNGTVSAWGTGGSAMGNYAGTTTTYGSTTTYVPVTVNRFAKFALYFAEAPKVGTGIRARELTPEELRVVGTRRAFAVQWVRDASPAYYADIFPGDIILQVNGKPADLETYRSENAFTRAS